MGTNINPVPDEPGTGPTGVVVRARDPIVPRDNAVEQPADQTIPLEMRPVSTVQLAISYLVKAAIAAGFVIGGWFVAERIYAAAPVAERSERPRSARLVEIVSPVPARQGPPIVAWGEVRAANQLTVRPEVSGTITWVHPELEAGGFIPAGDVVARLDDRDLKLAVARIEAEIAGIQARVAIEQGQADLGERELTRLTRNLTDRQRALILRKPQMAQLDAELAAAKAELEQARNAVIRAEVRAPFDAIVLSEDVAPGAMLTQSTIAAELVAADHFNVVLAVPVSMLGWIDADGQGTVTITQDSAWPSGATRTGRIVRTGSQLSETGRMAELVVRVDDPLSRTPENRGRPPLLLGSFVKGQIAGKAIENAVLLDRAHVRDNNTVWVMTAEDTLEIRPVQIAWRGAEEVLISGGVAAGDRIVATPLASYTQGMKLRLRESG